MHRVELRKQGWHQEGQIHQGQDIYLQARVEDNRVAEGSRQQVLLQRTGYHQVVDIPVAGDILVAGDIPVAGVVEHNPVAGEDIPVAGEDIPVAGEDSPVAGEDILVAGEDIQVAGEREDILVVRVVEHIVGEDSQVVEEDTHREVEVEGRTSPSIKISK